MSKPGKTAAANCDFPGNTSNTPDELQLNHQFINNMNHNLPSSSSFLENRNNLLLLTERVVPSSSSSSCSVVATAGTPSSPRSVRSGISSTSLHGISVPVTHASGGTVVEVGSGNIMPAVLGSAGPTSNSDLSIQCSVPCYGAAFSSPLPSRPMVMVKRPSSALSEGSLFSSTAVAIGDSLPRDDELTTVDDDELNNIGDANSTTEKHEMMMMIEPATSLGHSAQLDKGNHQSNNTPTHFTRVKCADDGSSVMGGRKAFESSNYADNLDELGSFSVKVEGPDLRFSCAHFVAYNGYRERLHGHTYQVKVVLGGRLNSDGYVIDFELCKRVVRETCKVFNEYMIIPMKSDVLSIKIDNGSIHLVTQEGSTFLIPESDCLCLPIMHSTAEELAAHFWNVALQAFTPQYLQTRGVTWLEVCVAERPTQEAQYRRHIPIPPQL